MWPVYRDIILWSFVSHHQVTRKWSLERSPTNISTTRIFEFSRRVRARQYLESKNVVKLTTGRLLSGATLFLDSTIRARIKVVERASSIAFSGRGKRNKRTIHCSVSPLFCLRDKHRPYALHPQRYKTFIPRDFLSTRRALASAPLPVQPRETNAVEQCVFSAQ